MRARLGKNSRIAAALFRRPSRLLDKINRTAELSEWLRSTPDVPVLEDRFALYDFVRKELVGEAPIDYLEFGVWQGESLFYWSSKDRNGTSRFYGFDSFEGLPEDFRSDLPKGSFSMGGKPPHTDDPRIFFMKGWFDQTLPAFKSSYKPASTIIIHNDSDLYSSTLYVLTQLDSVLVSGSLVLFDELFNVDHEFAALMDYLSAYRRKLRPVALTREWIGRVAFRYE